MCFTRRMREGHVFSLFVCSQGANPCLWSLVLSRGYPGPGWGINNHRGTPTPPTHTEPGWLSGTGGIPLAFTKEDFLVNCTQLKSLCLFYCLTLHLPHQHFPVCGSISTGNIGYYHHLIFLRSTDSACPGKQRIFRRKWICSNNRTLWFHTLTVGVDTF